MVRLDGLAIDLPGLTRLAVHRSANGTTAWALDVSAGRLTLVVSPDPFRGFSGEGTLLPHLVRPGTEVSERRLLHELGWSPVVDPAGLGRRTVLPSDDVAAGLAWLAACGQLGYDLAEGAWFAAGGHRRDPET